MNDTTSSGEHLEPEVPSEIGALRLWWDELRSGERRTTDFDALWRAACCEARAREALHDGLENAARQDRIEAARIIVAAVAGRST